MVLYWVYRTTRFLNQAPNAEEYNPTSKLLLCMFVPFYIIYWFYKHGQRIDMLAKTKRVESDIAIMSLIFGIFMPIVSVILMQEKINSICRANPPREGSYQQNADSAHEAQPHSAVAEIKQLKELLDSGIITQEEFDAKKKQLLGL